MDALHFKLCCFIDSARHNSSEKYFILLGKIFHLINYMLNRNDSFFQFIGILRSVILHAGISDYFASFL